MNTDTPPSYMLSCDWGTTSFRLRLVASKSGEILNEITSSGGVKTIDRSRSSHIFQDYLSSQIAKLREKSSQDLKSVPIVISGMATSSIGWKELPYGTLPCSLKNPPFPVKKIPATTLFPHDVLLISGICSSNDVMRGEETQVLGLTSHYNINNAICILPGTHSKHIFVENKTITRFKTYMTGELFELISSQSILKNSVSLSEENIYDNAFKEGIKQALRTNLLHDLFSIRANDLLHQSNHQNNYNFLSGLLIGSELRDLRRYSSQKLYLAGEEALQHRYVVALQVLDLNVQPVKDSGDLTIYGHQLILNYFNQQNGDQ